jgi:hypothetical protein
MSHIVQNRLNSCILHSALKVPTMIKFSSFSGHMQAHTILKAISIKIYGHWYPRQVSSLNT